MPRIYVVSLVLSIFMIVSNTSCNSNANDEEVIDHKYFVKSISRESTTDSTLMLSKQVELMSTPNFFVNQKQESDGEGATSSPDEGFTIVSLKTKVADLFDPNKCGCPLPDKIKKKLRKSAEEGNPWAPDYVARYISSFNDTVLLIKRQNLNSVLHWVKIKKKSSSVAQNYLLQGAETYRNFDFMFFLNPNFSSFFYSLDCSGYLSAAIEASAAVPGADIKTNAKLALQNQKSMFIGGAAIISPISAAYYGDQIKMDTALRIQILEAIVNLDNFDEDDAVLDINVIYEMVWSSNQGKSSFNGEGSLAGGGRAGVGVASISATGSSGGEIARKSSYTEFETLITATHKFRPDSEVKIAQIKQLIKSLKKTQ